MDTQKFLEWATQKFREDGFDLFISDQSNGVTISVILQIYPYTTQSSRFFPFDCRPSEAALIYWDLSNSIRRKERYAETKTSRSRSV